MGEVNQLRCTLVNVLVLSWWCPPFPIGATELTFPVQKLASAGRHILTMGDVPFSDLGFLAYGFNGEFTGPTFRVYPGESLNIDLVNNLPASRNQNCTVTGSDFCYLSTTNLHTHGLHVNATSGTNFAADDIFVEVLPGESVNYSFAIPSDHMPGIFWYHPHVHHAATIQAAGGAAGVLIVDDPDDYLPNEYNSMIEKVLLISTHDLGLLERIASDSDLGVFLDATANASSAGLNPSAVVLVNGQILPTMSIIPNAWHRIRVVYNANSENIWFNTNKGTNGTNCSMRLLAKDGVYLQTCPRAITSVHLVPGARADFALSCSCTTYPCSITLGGQVDVRGRRSGGWTDVDILTILINDTTEVPFEELSNFTPRRPCYLVDMQNATIPNSSRGELNMEGRGINAVTWNGEGEGMTYTNVVAQGTMETWPALTRLTAGNVYEMIVDVGNHPLHFHINPFQIMSMVPNNSYYDGYYQAGDWHDTFSDELVESFHIRLQTHKFTGKMIVHCHIYDHEDEGMMAWLEINGSDNAVWYGAEIVDPTCIDIYGSAFDVASDHAATFIGVVVPFLFAVVLPLVLH